MKVLMGEESSTDVCRTRADKLRDARNWHERWVRSLKIQGREDRAHPFVYDTDAQDGFCECGQAREAHES